MATKRLRSMLFPGLSGSYTVPQSLTDLEDFNSVMGDALAVISVGNTHAQIPADMFVYIYNHSVLDDGLYKNISGATITSNYALSTSNVELVSGGGLNAVKAEADQLKTSLNTYVRPNLLDNWYFVGGGSQAGDGKFPINQRGQTTYSGLGTYTVDRWINNDSSTQIAIANTNDRLNYKKLAQFLSQPIPSGKYTVSFINASGILRTGTATFNVGADATLYSDADFSAKLLGSSSFVGSNGAPKFILECSYWSNVVAVKLELGSTQTLAHQENGVWVLNEIPNYDEQMMRCCASTADSTDTYANVPYDVLHGISQNIIHKLVVPANGSVLIPIANYGSAFLMGLFQGYKATNVSVIRSGTNLWVKDLSTLTDFSSTYYTFATDTNGVRLTSTYTSKCELLCIYTTP